MPSLLARNWWALASREVAAALSGRGASSGKTPGARKKP
jgi:hypothetical protein